MESNDLRGLLSQLHARLGSAPTLDADDRRQLLAVLADIEKVLEKNPPGRRTDASGIESLAAKFEADHPALADGLRRIVDTLAKAGI